MQAIAGTGRNVVAWLGAMLAGLLPAVSLGASLPEEIIITARKYEERLQQVPLAVSVLDARAISELNLARLEDIARLTPGFSFDSATGRAPAAYRPVIRGLTTVRNGIVNASSAATFIDGVYVGGSTQATELYNLERVEILRGPQTALYGRNTYAGAINYVTRRPSLTPEAEAVVTLAGHRTREFAGWISGPVAGEALTGFLAAGHREYGGEYINVRDGSQVGDEQSRDLTGKLYWQPDETLSLMLRVGLQYTDDGHYPMALQPASLNNCCFRSAEAPRARGYFVGRVDTPDRVNLATDLLEAAGGAGTEIDRRLLTLDLRWTPRPGRQLRSITGWIEDDIERGLDLSYNAATAPPGLFNRLERLEQRDLSQELLWSVEQDRLRWLVGAYFYDGRLDERRVQRTFLLAGNPVVQPGLGLLFGESVSSRALFAGFEADLDTRWTAGVELRRSRDEITKKGFSNPQREQQQRFDRRFRGVAPRFTLSWRADENHTLYGNIARGIKPGDFNSQVPDESYRAVDEESVWSYELGLRGRSADARHRYAVALYWNDVSDQQLTSLVELPDSSTASIVTNVGRTRVIGAEVEWAVALTERLGFETSYAWTDAEYRRHISPEEADLRGSDGSPEQNQLLGDVAGNRLPRVAEHMVAAVLRFEHPLSAQLRGVASADWSWESSRYAQEHNLIETGGRHLLGLRAGLEADRWSVSFWARNLLDDDTPVDILRFFDLLAPPLDSFPQAGSSLPSSTPRAFAIALPRGRQYGVTLRTRF